MIVEQIAASIYSAILRDFPNDDKGGRPSVNELEIVSFPQTWGSTTLGFGGVGGAALTTAQTVIVSSYSTACVYFGGTFAYMAPMTKEFISDMQAHNVASVAESRKYRRILK